MENAKGAPITATVHRARELSGLGNTKIYELIRSGELRSTQVGTRRLIFVDSLRALLEKGVR
ncbi:excisionase family DNA-binding protein [Alsobacter sp. R-9]